MKRMQINLKGRRQIMSLAFSAMLCGAMTLAVSALARNAPPSGGPPQGASGAEAEETNPPVIDSIEIKGSTKFTADQMMKVLTMKVGDTISRTKVKDSCNNIAALYQKQGGDAAVSPNITHPAEGHVQVVLTVDESGKGGFSFHP
jgi:Surface antigen variable number repeat